MYKNNNKISQLVFDMRVARKLLKMNSEVKFCPFCGTPIDKGCDCHKNMIVDIKKKRNTENETVLVFQNNASFKNDFEAMITEFAEDSDCE